MKKSAPVFTRLRPLAAALGLCLTISAALAQDPLANGGFEEGAEGWSGPGMKTGGVVTENPAEGKNCLKLTGGFILQGKIVVEGGKSYKISMKIRTEDAPEGSVYVQLSYRGGDGPPTWFGPDKVTVNGHSEKALYTTGGTQGWKEFSVVTPAPPWARQCLVYLRKTGDAGAAYFDDVRIEQVDVPAVPPPPRAPGDDKVLFNGDFEKGITGWTVKGDGSISTENPAQGVNGLKLTNGFVFQDKRPVEGGKRYKVSMKIRNEGAPERSIYVQLSYRGDGVGVGWVGPNTVQLDKRTEKSLFTVGGGEGWQNFSAVIEPPAKADQMLFYLRKIAGTAGAAYFDDIQVEPTTEEVTTEAELKREVLAKEWLSPALPAEEAAAALEKIAAVQPPQTKLVLAKDGVVAYQVHVGTKADVITLNSAHELADYLGKISGGTAPALSHDEHPTAGPLVIVGKENALTKKLCPDIPYEELGKDGFVIRTVGSNIVIAGNTPGGTMYGVNWFLDHKLGVKWLSPDYTHIPQAKTIEVAALNEKQIPRFSFRQVLSREGSTKTFGAHNLLNGNSHGAYGAASPPEINHWDGSWQRPGASFFFKNLFTKWEMSEHRDWFTGGQFALMNPAARKGAAEAVIERLKGNPNYGDVWFSIMNNDMGFDPDKASVAFAQAHGDTLAAPRLDMMIAVGEEVRKTLPEAKLAFNAYRWSFTPPTGMTVPDYLLVFPMTIQVNYSMPLFEGPNVALGKGIEGWNAIAKNVLVWDHVTNFFGYLQPTPNIYPICKSIRWLAGLDHVFGYFAEGSWNTRGAEFAALRAWIIARMLWDPKTDYQAAITEYCDAYYGPAGKTVKQYIDFEHEASVKSGAPLYEKTNVDSKMFTLDFVLKADALFDQAEAEVAGADPVYLQHVREARMPVDYVILMRRNEWQAAATAQKVAFQPATEKRTARLMETAKVNGVDQYAQGSSIEKLPGMFSIERHDAPKPEIAANLAPGDWMEVQDPGINCYGKDTALVADPAASDGGAARFKGGLQNWFLQLEQGRLPEEGLWDIYAVVRADADSAADSDVALVVGGAPPFNNFTKVTWGELKDGKYHAVKVPKGPFRWNPDEDHSFYIHGDSKNIKGIYVDRFVLIRAPDKSGVTTP